MWMFRGHNECGTVCGFNPQNNILSLTSAPGWIMLYILMSITHYEERYLPYIYIFSKWELHQLVAETNMMISECCTFQDPKWKHCPPAVQRNRKKKTAVGVNMVIYSLMSEKDATLYERKIPTAIDSRGSIRSVGFGRSMSNRHEQLQEWYFYRGV